MIVGMGSSAFVSKSVPDTTETNNGMQALSCVNRSPLESGQAMAALDQHNHSSQRSAAERSKAGLSLAQDAVSLLHLSCLCPTIDGGG